MCDQAANKRILVEKEFGSFLSSRATASNLRKRIEELVNEEKIVIVDLTNIESMSEGFADEVFAVLIAARGTAWFKRQIRIEGATKFTRDVILAAVLERKTRPASSSAKNLARCT